MTIEDEVDGIDGLDCKEKKRQFEIMLNKRLEEGLSCPAQGLIQTDEGLRKVCLHGWIKCSRRSKDYVKDPMVDGATCSVCNYTQKNPLEDTQKIPKRYPSF